LRDSSTRASWSKESFEVMGLTNLYGLLIEALFVDRCRVFQDRFGNYPLAILEKTEKTTVPTRMTSQTRRMPCLGDFHQQNIVVTIHTQLMHGLDVAGFCATG
jgi:hypothetical protein